MLVSWLLIAMFVFEREHDFPDSLFRSLQEGWKAQPFISMTAASEGVSTPALPLVTNSSGTHSLSFPFFKANFTRATVSALKESTATVSHFRHKIIFLN